MEMKSNEQLKLDGDCSVCRRKNCCKSEYGPSKKYMSRVTRQIIQEVFIKKIAGIPLETPKGEYK